MPDRVVIVGGLRDATDRDDLLRRLRERHSAISWDWIQPINFAYSLPKKPFQRLLHELRTLDPDDPAVPTVIKLVDINGREAHMLHEVCDDPVRPPRDLATAEALIDWLVSPTSGLLDDQQWTVTTRQAALLAILAKLLRNKAWNKDSQGHNWTKETDLLGQAPVKRPQFPSIYVGACDMIERANGTLLLTKGANQGKTPKEWCINLKYLGEVKRAFTERSMKPLHAVDALATLLEYAMRDSDDCLDVDPGIVSQRVLTICRAR